MPIIKVLVLDLGNTLVRDGAVLPYVPEALQALKGFETAPGQPLELSLISDYLPADPPTQENIAERFSEYIALLDEYGLRSFFEPVERHVTLSTHAGENKPHRRVFERALERLGANASLDACLVITEAAGHVIAARRLGMSALQFGAPGNGEPKFENWAEGLFLVARLVGHDGPANLRTAVRIWLSVRLDMELISLNPPVAGQPLHIVANQLCPIPGLGLGLADADPVYVPMPAHVDLVLDRRGAIEHFTVHSPSQEDQEEAAYFVRSLIQHSQLAPSADAIEPGATHVIEPDAKGRRVLRRRGYSVTDDPW